MSLRATARVIRVPSGGRASVGGWRREAVPPSSRSRQAHAGVIRLAAERNETIDETVSRALRAFRQDTMGRDLSAELRQDEVEWLGADAG